MSWTPAQERMLRDFYAQYTGQAIPVAEIAAVLGKNRKTVAAWAMKLGLTEHGRPSPRRIHEPVACPICGESFRPESVGGRIVQTCSTSCGQRKRAAEGRHNRAMTGKSHTDETKAAIGLKSRQMWDEMPAVEREIRAERMRAIGTGQRPTERTHTRGRGGRRDDLGGLYVRSGWEANYARWLNYRRDVIGDIVGWTYEPQTFYFPVKRGTVSYTPDFRIDLADGSHEWHEVKGWLTQQGATALKRFAKYYPAERLILVDSDVYRSIARDASRLIGAWE